MKRVLGLITISLTWGVGLLLRGHRAYRTCGLRSLPCRLRSTPCSRQSTLYKRSYRAQPPPTRLEDNSIRGAMAATELGMKLLIEARQELTYFRHHEEHPQDYPYPPTYRQNK
jgi:hypothetical protein